MNDIDNILSFENFTYAGAGTFQISASLGLNFTKDRLLKKVHASAWINKAIGVELIPYGNLQLYIQNCILSNPENVTNAMVSPWTSYNNVLNYNSQQGFIEIEYKNGLLLPQGKTIYFDLWVMASAAFALNDEMISHISLYF